MRTRIAGYDVGGAHLKVALSEDGRITAATQIACPLWRGLDQLDAALGTALAITAGADAHRITMTGELADVFPDRYTGVSLLVERLTAHLGPTARFWMGRRGLGSGAEAMAHHDDVASTNFLATAVLAAGRLHGRGGLLIDMGSTTTDIVPLEGGNAVPSAMTDADRLTSGELVYTGLTRTPVMAVTDRSLFGGRWQMLARDPFATMADVRRVLDTLPGGVDLHGTADGRGKSREESIARLARCFGRDAAPGDGPTWAVAARQIAEAQLQSIVDGCLQVLSRRPGCGLVVVSAGIGSDVAAEVGRRLGAGCVAFGTLLDITPPLDVAATAYAPAVAMALLPEPRAP